MRNVKLALLVIIPICFAGTCPPPGGQTASLLNESWEMLGLWTSETAQGSATFFYATFQPTAAGKTITLTFSGSSAALRIPATVGESGAIFDDESAPTTSTTTLSFVTQNANVHYLMAGNPAPISGYVLGDTISVTVVESP